MKESALQVVQRLRQTMGAHETKCRKTQTKKIKQQHNCSAQMEARKNIFRKLWADAVAVDHVDFIKQLHTAFPLATIPIDFINNLALTTQVCIKRSKPLFVHGYLLYAAMFQYAQTHRDQAPLFILETGTARGFSSLCMAKALEDAGVAGTIHTFDNNLIVEKCRAMDGSVDKLQETDFAKKRIFWNCIADASGPKTRMELIAPWHDLAAARIVFHECDVYSVLESFLSSSTTRINFAFFDAKHTESALSFELKACFPLMRPGDVIVCDDYTAGQCPGVVAAIDNFLRQNPQVDSQKYYATHGQAGEYQRGYVHMTCNSP